jgi:outer membrane protein TolC
MFRQHLRNFPGTTVALLLLLGGSARGQAPNPLGYSVATPRPISPAAGTTNPSAQAAQSQNPYLGSVPSKPTDGVIELSLRAAIERGLRYNLGLIESNQAAADVRARRLRALSALLPQISARGRQAYEDISFKEIGLKLPPLPGIGSLAPTTGGFGYQDARIALGQKLYSAELRDRYKAEKSAEQASIFSIKDSRDVVVFAVATAYLQVIASAARVDAARAQLASAVELDRQTSDRVAHELAPEIDSIRAEVGRQTAEQRIVNSVNQFEKDKLTLARVIGFSVDQKFNAGDTLSARPLTGLTEETATAEALQTRADLAAAEAAVKAAEATLRAEKAQRLPVISFNADYGGGGGNIGNFNRLYSLSGDVSIPLYTGGRIPADIERAQADLARRQAEYEDLKGRIGYDVRVAWLDLSASESSVRVSERNKALAQRALTQAEDRYNNGVTNYLEVVQAREAVASADENRIDSLYSLNIATVSLARALGSAETKLSQLSGGK